MKFRPPFFTYLPLFVAIGLLAGCKKSADNNASTTGRATTEADAASTSGSPSSGPADEAVVLKIQWPVGLRRTQKMEMAQSMEIPLPQNPKPMKQNVTFGQEFTLSSVRDWEKNGHEVELEFLAANMSVMMNGSEVAAFDTRGEATGDESNPAIKPFRQMVGKKIKYFLDASNHVDHVEGVKEFAEQVLGAAGGANNPMASIFTEDYFKQIMSHEQDLPPGPVKPGGSWPVHRDLILGPLGKGLMDLQYTFKNWEMHDKVRCAVLDFTGTLKATGTDTNGALGGMVTLQDGKCTGKSWFDPVAGYHNDTHMNLELNVNIKSFGAPATGANAGSSTVLHQDVNIKLLEATRK